MRLSLIGVGLVVGFLLFLQNSDYSDRNDYNGYDGYCINRQLLGSLVIHVHGLVKADSVLVLPQNFGGGLRWRTGIVWGIFKPDDASGKLWDLLQDGLTVHGLKLDVVYEDSAFPLPPNYLNVIRFPS